MAGLAVVVGVSVEVISAHAQTIEESIVSIPTVGTLVGVRAEAPVTGSVAQQADPIEERIAAVARAPASCYD